MEPSFTDIDELLAKSLAGEADAAEENRIGQWLETSPDNRRHWENLQWLWQQAGQAQTRLPREPDTELALQKVKTIIHSGKGGTGRRIPLYSWLSAAAAVVLLAVAVYFFLPAGAPPAVIASGTQMLQDTLNDGTRIILNRQSGVALAAAFNRHERRLKLEGEAYFEVTRDTLRPFVVEVQSLEVTVLGTSFNIDNLSEKNRVIVSVQTGKVQLKSGRQTELLTAGESAVYDNTSGRISRLEQPQPDILGERYRVFRFDGAPMQEVVERLEKAYGVKIVLKNPDLADCPLTSAYYNENIARIFELFEETMSFRVHFDGRQYVIDGEACE